MEKKPAKSSKAKAKPKQLGATASSAAVAAALQKHWPEEAAKILKVMEESTISASMKKKLGRCTRALDRLRQKEAPKTA
jgi:hypothetical protein